MGTTKPARNNGSKNREERTVTAETLGVQNDLLLSQMVTEGCIKWTGVSCASLTVETGETAQLSSNHHNPHKSQHLHEILVFDSTDRKSLDKLARKAS